MKAIYKPFGLLIGLLGGLLAKRITNVIWGRFDDEAPPKATTEESPLAKILAAAALQGLVLKMVRVAIDRAGARGYQHLTGTWPGEQRPEPKP